MRVGIVARCDDTGLGNQTRELVNMLNPDKIMLINSTFFNENKQHPEWYDGYNYKTTIKGFPTTSEISEFLRGVDVVISCETFYNPKFINLARSRGIKTILQYNYEFFGNLVHTDWSLPDVLVAPSLWNMDKIVELFGDKCKVVYLPPPTNHENFKNAKENNMSKFHNRILHVGGKAAVKDRNGTNTVIEMLKYSKGDYEVVVKTQSDLGIKGANERLTIETKTTKEPEDLYSGYDAMVLPRRYAGLCLPMNEALLSGLPVFMPRISPNNVILPDKWTVEANKIDEFKAKAIIDVYDISPKTLARTVDDYMEKKDNLIKQEAFNLGFINFSTESLKDKYTNLINS